MSKLIVPRRFAAASAAAKRVNLNDIPAVVVPNDAPTLADEIAAPIPSGLPKALFWRVHVMPVGMRTASKGGIMLTEKMTEDQQWVHGLGKIVGVGPLAYKGAQWEACDPAHLPKVGDIVLFNPKSPARVTKDDHLIVILNDDQITAKVDPAHAEGFQFFEGLLT